MGIQIFLFSACISLLGYSLKPVLDAMWDWGENYKVKNGYPPATSK